MRVRALSIAAFVELGRAPTTAELAERAQLPGHEVESALRRLDELRAVALRPGTLEIWTAFPFSATRPFITSLARAARPSARALGAP